MKLVWYGKEYYWLLFREQCRVGLKIVDDIKQRGCKISKQWTEPTIARDNSPIRELSIVKTPNDDGEHTLKTLYMIFAL